MGVDWMCTYHEFYLLLLLFFFFKTWSAGGCGYYVSLEASLVHLWRKARGLLNLND